MQYCEQNCIIFNNSKTDFNVAKCNLGEVKL